MVDHTRLAALVDWCREHDVRLISDEIYHGITYPADPSALGARGTSAWELDRTTVVVSSFSKYWGMTGWRLGWALVPDDLRPAVDALAGNVALCPPTPGQLSAIGAFTDASYAEADARVAALAGTRAGLLGRTAPPGVGAGRPRRRGLLPVGGHRGPARPPCRLARLVPGPAGGGRRGPGARHRHGSGGRPRVRPSVVRRRPRGGGGRRRPDRGLPDDLTQDDLTQTTLGRRRPSTSGDQSPVLRWAFPSFVATIAGDTTNPGGPGSEHIP